MKNKKKRECRPCTGCCDGWVQMTIGEVPVYPGKPCPQSSGAGCNDYHKRPVDPCGSFNCGWIIENSPLPDWMKPDNAKAIVIFGKLNWRGHAVDLAVPIGNVIPPRTLNWLKQFSEKHLRPLIYSEQIVADGALQKEQQVFGHGPADFQQDVLNMLQQGAKLW